MCGGRGTRLGAPTEKPLLNIDGTPMIDRVLAALADSRVDTIHAVVSPHAPTTRAHLEDRLPFTGRLSIIDAPGQGYVTDLQYALEAVDLPVLTVATDLPLLTSSGIDSILDAYDEHDEHDGGSLTVCVSEEMKRGLGVSVGATLEYNGRTLVPTGCNVVGDAEDTMYKIDTIEFAVNVNRLQDAQIAEVWCP